MKIDLRKLTIIIGVIFVVTTVCFFTFKGCSGSPTEPEPETEDAIELLFGIEFKNYTLDEGEVGSGQTLSEILGKYGITAATVDKLSKVSESVFPLRNMRAGHNYTAFIESDTTAKLAHLVYEQSIKEYIVFSFTGDSVSVRKEQKDVHIERVKRSATISSSLWNCMVEANMPPALSMDLSDLYAWSIDFFGLQEGDHFTVIYDQEFVDTVSLGVGRIWGAIFHHNGKDYYAFPFKQGEKITYWDENGNSLRKNILKAPLKFSRISSKFTNSRYHPVLKIRRPHHGVDYAAPSGTHVFAVADGTIIYKGYSGGGGNTIKIKHGSNLTSGYMHLRGYGKNIAKGKRVSQGDLIGYVGSTGLSTGPHLDFRIWRGSTPINPLTVPSEPAEPIALANKAKFEIVKSRIIEELQGTLADSLRITQLDSLDYYTTPTPSIQSNGGGNKQ